jgi:peroxiredoxin
MPEERIREALRTPERPIEPDPRFREELFQRLLVEQGSPRRPSGVVPPRRIVDRGRRTLLAAAVVIGSFAVLAALLWPLRGWMSGPLPGSDITPSTPFRATIAGSFTASAGGADRAGDFEILLSYRGPDAWRIDVIGGSAQWQPLINENVGGVGSYVLWDGANLIGYDAESGSFVPQPEHAPSFSPLNLLGFLDQTSGWQRACETGFGIGEETIAGRPTEIHRCPAPAPFSSSTGAEVRLWVDTESRLILKLVSEDDPGQRSPPGPIAWYPGQRIEITSIRYNPDFAADLFAAPPGAPTTPASASGGKVTSLSIGDVVPTFEGRTLDGTAFDLEDVRGKPSLVYVWADWCEPCIDFPLDALDGAFATRETINVVTVAWGTDPSSIRAFVRDRGYRFPVVLPNNRDALDPWGLEAIPTILLLDTEGQLVGAYGGWGAELAGASDLEALLDALAAGDPLPEIAGTTPQPAVAGG